MFDFQSKGLKDYWSIFSSFECLLFDSLLSFFFFLAVLSGVISYMSIDPMKSSFFLICSLLFSMPIISFSLHVWFSYFICLLFLSGIFVILVYFSSLSKFSVVENYFFTVCFILNFIFFKYVNIDVFDGLGLSSFYLKVYWFVFMYVLLILLFFMNFSSFFLNFSGALRKV